jgi:hypothetical protein
VEAGCRWSLDSLVATAIAPLDAATRQVQEEAPAAPLLGLQKPREPLQQAPLVGVGMLMSWRSPRLLLEPVALALAQVLAQVLALASELELELESESDLRPLVLLGPLVLPELPVTQ